VKFEGPSSPEYELARVDESSYSIRWCATVSGEYDVHILLDGEPLKSSPVPFFIYPGLLKRGTFILLIHVVKLEKTISEESNIDEDLLSSSIRAGEYHVIYVIPRFYFSVICFFFYLIGFQRQVWKYY